MTFREVTLIGAAGSGKHDVAKAVRAKLLVGYTVDAARFVTGRGDAAGLFGGYAVNLEIAMLRHGSRRFHILKEQSFVTIGSIVDSLAYSGLSCELLASEPVTDQQRSRMLREVHTSTVLAGLLFDTMPTADVYYLPTRSTEHYDQRVDEAIREVIDKFNVKVKQSEDDPVSFILKDLEAA